MTLFPSWFLAALVYGGIALTVIGACALFLLLARDMRKKSLW